MEQTPWLDLVFKNPWVAFIGAAISTIIGFIIFGLMSAKLNRNRSKALSYMTFSILFLTLAAFFESSYHLANLWIPTFAQTFFFSNMSFTCLAVSNVLLFAFTRTVFDEQINNFFYWIFVILEILVIPIIWVVWYLDFTGIIIITELIEYAPFVLLILCSLTIYGSLTISAFRIRSKMQSKSNEEMIIHKGLLFIALTGILLSGTTLLFVLHELIYNFVFVTLGWVLGIIAAINISIGYVPGERLKKRWTSFN
ncbi:MAG: hypothetical protein JW776_08820 [Candidatus Lokiarchaeota archaeon]|nr:hypothetical protein [Candidatus Lokiarchaeota archaeon]